MAQITMRGTTHALSRGTGERSTRDVAAPWGRSGTLAGRSAGLKNEALRDQAAGRDNVWVASQLHELAARIAMVNGSYRSSAYRRAADTVSQLGRAIAGLREADGAPGLEGLPGIGPQIAATICELLDTGTTQTLEEMRRRAPVDVLALLEVDGVGVKTLKRLWDRLGVRTLEDLDTALRDGRVEALPGFGPRRCERLRQAVAIRRSGRERIPHERAARIARWLRRALAGHPSVVDCAIAGSLRRRQASVGDIDLVASTRDPNAVAKFLRERPEVEHVYSRGPRRVSVRLREGIDVDLRTIAPESFGSALLYFTGSRAHHVALRRLALAQGLRLNEYGLFRGGRRIAGSTERGIYEALALPYLSPERRRDEDEIRTALRRARKANGGDPGGSKALASG